MSKTAKDLKVGDAIYKRGTPRVEQIVIDKKPYPETDYDNQDGFIIEELHWLPDATRSQSDTLFTTFEEAKQATIEYFEWCLKHAQEQTEPKIEFLP